MPLHIKKQSFYLGDFKRTGYTYTHPSLKAPAVMAYEAVSKHYKLDEETLVKDLCGGINETEKVVHACLMFKENARLVAGFDSHALALVYGDDEQTLHVYTLTSEDVLFLRTAGHSVQLVSEALYTMLDELSETDDEVMRSGLRLAFAQLDSEAASHIVEYARAALG